MLWSVVIAAGIISGILYLITFPEAAAELARINDEEDDEVPSGPNDSVEMHQEDCDKAWRMRLKVCDRIAKAREDLCASRRRITKAQKQIHNLKVAARRVHMQTITVTANLTRELVDHHSTGQIRPTVQSETVLTATRTCGSTIQQQQLPPSQYKNTNQQRTFGRRSNSQEIQQSKSNRPLNSRNSCNSCGRKKRMSTTEVFDEDYISGDFIISVEDYIDKLIAASTCKEIWGNECCIVNNVKEKFLQPPEDPSLDPGDIDEILSDAKKPVCEIKEVIIETRDDWQDTELDVTEDKGTEISESFELTIIGEKGTSTSDLNKTGNADSVEKKPEEEELAAEELSKPVDIKESEEGGETVISFKRSTSITEVFRDSVVVEVVEKDEEGRGDEKEGEGEDVEEKKDGAAEDEEYQYTLSGVLQINVAELIQSQMNYIVTSINEVIDSLLKGFLETYLPEREDKPYEKVVVEQVYVKDEDEEAVGQTGDPDMNQIASSEPESAKQETLPQEEAEEPADVKSPQEETPQEENPPVENPPEENPPVENPPEENTANENADVPLDDVKNISYFIKSIYDKPSEIYQLFKKKEGGICKEKKPDHCDELLQLLYSILSSEPNKFTNKEQVISKSSGNEIHKETQICSSVDLKERLNPAGPSRLSEKEVKTKDQILEIENNFENCGERNAVTTYYVPLKYSKSTGNCYIDKNKRMFYLRPVSGSNNRIKRDEKVFNFNMKQSGSLLSNFSAIELTRSPKIMNIVQQNENEVSKPNENTQIESDVQINLRNNDYNEKEKIKKLDILHKKESTLLYSYVDTKCLFKNLNTDQCSLSSITSENVHQVHDYCLSFDRFGVADIQLKLVNDSISTEINGDDIKINNLMLIDDEVEISRAENQTRDQSRSVASQVSNSHFGKFETKSSASGDVWTDALSLNNETSNLLETRISDPNSPERRPSNEAVVLTSDVKVSDLVETRLSPKRNASNATYKEPSVIAVGLLSPDDKMPNVLEKKASFESISGSAVYQEVLCNTNEQILTTVDEVPDLLETRISDPNSINCEIPCDDVAVMSPPDDKVSDVLETSSLLTRSVSYVIYKKPYVTTVGLPTPNDKIQNILENPSSLENTSGSTVYHEALCDAAEEVLPSDDKIPDLLETRKSDSNSDSYRTQCEEIFESPPIDKTSYLLETRSSLKSSHSYIIYKTPFATSMDLSSSNDEMSNTMEEGTSFEIISGSIIYPQSNYDIQEEMLPSDDKIPDLLETTMSDSNSDNYQIQNDIEAVRSSSDDKMSDLSETSTSQEISSGCKRRQGNYLIKTSSIVIPTTESQSTYTVDNEGLQEKRPIKITVYYRGRKKVLEM